jgi:hypothetical protein
MPTEENKPLWGEPRLMFARIGCEEVTLPTSFEPNLDDEYGYSEECTLCNNQFDISFSVTTNEATCRAVRKVFRRRMPRKLKKRFKKEFERMYGLKVRKLRFKKDK